MIYDYLIVGCGLFGATFAHQATAAGKTCLIIEKSHHIAGHIHSAKVADIDVHVFGAHIFHTGNERVWAYVNQFATFNRFTNAPIANYKGKIYNLPFNMNTFYQMWGVTTPAEALAKLEEQRAEVQGEPANLEEQAIKLVGRDIYETLIKDYTEKQWGRPCKDLPAFIIRRLPVRLIFDNNYFNDPHQGIPVDGYDAMVQAMLGDTEVRLDTDYFSDQAYYDSLADKVLYTGPIDQFYNYRFGYLEYRSLRFETETLDQPNYQGNAVINYTDADTPYTRIIEHKHFNFGKQAKTVITREYPAEWQPGDEPYYPVNNAANQALFERYKQLAILEEKVFFGGRLAEYKYYNMDQVIDSALHLGDQING
ncbi:UDP-galactopyranose mutase [Oscillospiraceae bacterium HV4-5-C5C]|nr:UDP-galactopyranose mutase [Oscillospiraceae bacterium HV4-5-C5C]